MSGCARGACHPPDSSKYEFKIETELDDDLNLHIIDLIKFRDLIGFRHCTYKTFILEVLCSYVNYIKTSQVSFQTYLEELNVYKFSDSSKYNIPYYEIKVIAIKDIGIQRVYDIEVEDNHSFLANGVVVHNCSHDPKIIRKNELTAYIDGEKEKIKKLREKRDDKKNKPLKQKILDELNKKVEELKPYVEERTKVVKTISKNVMCAKRYYRFLKEPKGVIPTILQNLLDARKNTRKIIKENNNVIEKIVKENNEIIVKKEDSDKVNSLKMLNNVLDKRQWAYKISANSVASTTPIPCQINGKFIYKTIEEISKGNWKRINEEQEVSEPIDNLEVWSDMGFTKVKFVMRHYTNETLKRIVTESGIVTCTNDHSLLKPNGDEVKPSECNIGDELLHKECDSSLNCKNISIMIPENEKSKFFESSSEIESAKVFNLIRKHGYYIKIDFLNDTYIIQYSKLKFNTSNKIKKIENVNNPQYVYDIETENHHFAAGVGNMIVHNSMYGSMGVKRGYLPFMMGAMVTCFMGRTNIEVVAKTIPEKYGGELVYGDTDCVLATEPVLIMKDGIIDYKTVEELSDDNWKRINPNKEISYAKEGYMIWSDNGFTKIVNVVRCGIKKSLSRVLTHVGVINCSNEHSLLTEDLQSVTPLDIKIGDKLCISELPLPFDTPKNPIYNNKITVEIIEDYFIPECIHNCISAELAFVWGLFYADGSCGEYTSKTGYKKSTWAINNQDNNLLKRVCDILKRIEKTLTFKILNTIKSSNVNKLVAIQFSKKQEHAGTIVSFVDKYRNLFYDFRKYKKIPTIIFNSPFDIRQSFFMGYYAGDGSRKDPAISLSNKGAIGSAGLFYLLRSIGYQVSVNTRQDKPHIYKLTGSTPEKNMRYSKNTVKKIITYKGDENEYIYDIQTENHHFAAGVGQLVVHNSNYIHFPHLKTAEETWEYAEKVATEVSMLFPKPIDK